MRLDELINEKYNILNDNDLLTWQYIQGHKKECSSVSIEKLAAKCCISRTTISRFTQKLGFEGFKEFKIRLKMEYENDQVKKKSSPGRCLHKLYKMYTNCKGYGCTGSV